MTAQTNNDEPMTEEMWQKMWNGHSKSAQQVLDAMESALADYPDSEYEVEHLRDVMKKALLPLGNSISLAKRIALLPRAKISKQAHGIAPGHANRAIIAHKQPLEAGLEILKDHNYDLVAATSQRGHKFLTFRQLKALARFKMLEECMKMTKKEEVIEKLLHSGAFTNEIKERS